jgi:hypothetical protein
MTFEERLDARPSTWLVILAAAAGMTPAYDRGDGAEP